MAKFHGILGYVSDAEETSPGVYVPVVTERACRGDIPRNTQRVEPAETLNSNFNISNRFSVIADTYALDNLRYIRFLEWRGTKWAVSSAEIQYPRIVLTVNGVYNG